MTTLVGACARVRYFVANIGKMDQLFEAVFSPAAATTGVPFTRCGKCRKYMTFLPMRPQRLLCPTCNETYALPQDGTVKVYGEVRQLESGTVNGAIIAAPHVRCQLL